MDGCKVQDVHYKIHQITKQDKSIIYEIKFLEYGIPITQGYLLENVHFLYFLLFFMSNVKPDHYFRMHAYISFLSVHLFIFVHDHLNCSMPLLIIKF